MLFPKQDQRGYLCVHLLWKFERHKTEENNLKEQGPIVFCQLTVAQTSARNSPHKGRSLKKNCGTTFYSAYTTVRNCNQGTRKIKIRREPRSDILTSNVVNIDKCQNVLIEQSDTKGIAQIL